MAIAYFRYRDSPLDRKLTPDVTLMQIADKKEDFEHNWDKLLGKERQLALRTPKELQP
jgi:hypothetical protein